MGQPQPPTDVLPIVGVLASPDCAAAEWEAALGEILGPIRLQSPDWPFIATRYYEPEMGANLRRSFRVFAPRSPEGLAGWKLATGSIERRLQGAGGRRVNLDPGYLTLHALFLASTKPGIHRVYLGRGIYAEITLLRDRSAWRALPWTFPEFREDRYTGFLDACRDLLKRHLADAVRHDESSANR